MIPHTYPNEHHKGIQMTPRPPIRPGTRRRIEKDGPRKYIQARLAAAYKRALDSVLEVYGERTDENPEGISRLAMADAAREWAGTNSKN